MPPSLDEHYLDRPQARVRVLERAGQAPRAAIFLHGLTSSASTWTASLEGLPDDVRGIAYDTLGAGWTERRGRRRPITAADQRELLVAMLDEAGLEQAALIGHSMGARAALDLAWREPQRVRGLLLEAPAALGRRNLNPFLASARTWPTARAIEAAAPLLVPQLIKGKLGRLAGGLPIDEEFRVQQAGHALARPRPLVRGFVDTVGHVDVRRPSAELDRYAALQPPVWILRGGGDRDWMPEEHEARYRRAIPAARVMRWEGTGHAPHIEAPDRFRELLGEFLQEAFRERD